MRSQNVGLKLDCLWAWVQHRKMPRRSEAGELAMAKNSWLVPTIIAALLITEAPAAAGAAASSRYLFAWAGDADEQDSDFLAVVDVDPQSGTYGKVVSTALIGVKGTMPHHIEYETPPGATLFANGWKASHSFVLNIANPLQPTVAASFERAADYHFPHSFARLPNGNVLATFQATGEKYVPPGALVELDASGNVVRASPSSTPEIPNAINWPYSLAVLPNIDRVITTSTDMGLGPGWKSPETNHVQIWSMRDLKLATSVALPDSKQGKHHIYPAEPRQLADGSVYVNTFSCGLYRIEGIATDKPNAQFVHAFPSGPNDHDMCAVPLVIGKYWIQTVGAINGLVVLDTSDPKRPTEVSRIALDHRFHVPHWIAADRKSGRIAVTGMYDSWLAMLRFDQQTGKLSLDESFGEAGGIQFDRIEWPHGTSGKAIVHGTVFSR